MIRLAIVLDPFALLRESRRGKEPDPVACAHMAVLAGADLITIHLRSDRRHIQDRDLEILRQTAPIPLNLRISTHSDMVTIACEKKPDLTTLVPERQEEVAVGSGLDAVLHQDSIRRATLSLAESGLAVNLLVEPEIEQLKAATRAGCGGVEIYTGRFSRALDARTRENELSRIGEAARAGRVLELRVTAGGGLSFEDAAAVAKIEEIETIHVGHSLAARATLVGLDRAIRDLKNLMGAARRRNS